MKNFLISLVVAGLLVSCNSNSVTTTSTEKAPVDKLVANFCDGWNNHDSTGVKNQFLDDAILIDDHILTSSIAEMSSKWIRPNMPHIKSITPTKLQEWSTGDRAGYTGTYKMVFIKPKGDLGNSNGLLTVNWLKTAQGEWKITNAHIHSVD